MVIGDVLRHQDWRGWLIAILMLVMLIGFGVPALLWPEHLVESTERFYDRHRLIGRLERGVRRILGFIRGWKPQPAWEIRMGGAICLITAAMLLYVLLFVKWAPPPR